MEGVMFGNFAGLIFGGNSEMLEWLWPVIAIAAYFVLMRWVLPRFGVQT